MDTLKRFEDDWNNYIESEARMNNFQPMNVLPVDIQNDFGAEVFSATPTTEGCYRLVAARRTQGNSFEGQRITVLVVDENGVAMPGVPVAFSYSTADKYTLTADFRWQPPTQERVGHRAFIVRTGGDGEADQIQGSVVKANEPGGVTVFILTPEFSSDFVTGAGMLASHDGLHLTFQLRQAGVVPLDERLTGIEARLTKLERKREAASPPGTGRAL